MTKTQFMEKVAEKLRKSFVLSDYEISCDVFTKNNDTPRYGIVINKKGDAISPTIYIDNYYEDYINKKVTLSEVVEQLVSILQNVREHAAQYNSFSVDFDSCRTKIVYRLVSQKRNQKLLQQIPYIPFLNMAIIFSVVCNLSEQGLESLRINNELMKKWKVTTKELFRLADENTPRLFPMKIESMESVLFTYIGLKEDLFSEKADRGPILIATNESGINGASVILYKNMLPDIARKYDSNLYILPSSIHEVIIIPNENVGTLSELTEMVKDINEKHVSKEEVLADTAYYYDWQEKKFLY